MKILIINDYYSFIGGAESYFFNLSELLKNKGHEVFFFSTDHKPLIDPDYKYADFFPKAIKYSKLKITQYPKYAFKLFYNLETLDKLNKLIKEIQPDIIHTSSIFQHLTSSFIEPCYKNKIPTVMSLHGCELICPAKTMIFKHESVCKDELCIKGNSLHCIINKCENKKLINSLVASMEYQVRKWLRLKEKVDYFICPSQALLDLTARAGIDKKKLVLINNFLNDTHLNKASDYTNKGYFLYVGRLSKEKGVDILLKAMTELPEVKLHIVGTGNQEETLKEFAKEHNLNNVKFLGFKKGAELEEEYKNCIASILPSNWFENFPTTIMESFAYGKPVIASNIGGIPNMIINGETGILYEPSSINELILAIKSLYSSPELVKNMGINARTRAKEKFLSQIYFEKLLNLYNLVLKK